jgi:class 3 adenylate cyclase
MVYNMRGLDGVYPQEDACKFLSIMDENSAENSESGSTDIEKLLAEKERLESAIHEKFTRHITVMFTDLKGSTSMAETQGDIFARSIIKKHTDILVPVIKNNSGTLVKFMGDGSMSFFENAADAVLAAIEIQKQINDLNKTKEGGLGINLRVGINSGKGIVEENDIFGDVVNVASRYESIAEPDGIYISERTNAEIRDRKDEFFCRFIKMTTLKGKQDEVKVYKIYWKPDEIAKVKQLEAVGVKSTLTGGRKSAISRPMIKKRSSLDHVSISEEKNHISTIEREIKETHIRKGESLKISNEDCRITGNIFVDMGAVVTFMNTKLYFAENTGIVVEGSIRATNALFSAIDAGKRWRNVTIYCTRKGTNILENCRFHFAGGISGKVLKEKFNITRPTIHDNGLYGGGLFIAGGSEREITIKNLTFNKCTAHEGGGMYLHKSKAFVNHCLFESCGAMGSGGGMVVYDSNLTIKDCTFNKCSSSRDGGGIYSISSKFDLETAIFRSCLSKYHGGGICCTESKPSIKNCRFERCISAKDGGGIYGDRKTKAKITFASYANCKPNDTNL